MTTILIPQVERARNCRPWTVGEFEVLARQLVRDGAKRRLTYGPPPGEVPLTADRTILLFIDGPAQLLRLLIGRDNQRYSIFQGDVEVALTALVECNSTVVTRAVDCMFPFLTETFRGPYDRTLEVFERIIARG